MSIKLGSSSVSKLYIGASEATKAYLGSDLIADTGGGGGGDYVAKAVHINNDVLLLCSSFGAANSSVVLNSYWIKQYPGSGGGIFITDPDVSYTNISNIADAAIDAFVCDNVENNQLRFHADVDSSVLRAAYHHILVAAKTDRDAGTKFFKVYLNKVDVTAAVDYDGDPSFIMTYNGLPFVVLADTSDPVSAGTKSDLADFWWSSGIDPFDVSGSVTAAVLDAFIDADGKPVDPATAVALLGTPDILFQRTTEDPLEFGANKGSGGLFAWTGPGTPTTTTTSPSD